MLFLCKVALLLKLVEGSTFPTIGLKNLRCLLCCHLLYCLSRAEFGDGIVGGRQALGEMIVIFHIK